MEQKPSAGPPHTANPKNKLRHRNSKFNVNTSKSGRERRTFKGRTYDSIVEMEYAMVLDGLLNDGHLVVVIPQPIVQLGEDFTYRPDFFVMNYSQASHNGHFIDVKGREDKRFPQTKRLWKKYGRLDLHIVSRTSTGFTTKIIYASQG